MDISGKKAVVFGGTSGIGLATCHQLIAGGAEVVEAGLDAEGAALIVDRNQRRDDRERVEALRRKRRTVDLSKISQQMALIQCCKQKRS